MNEEVTMALQAWKLSMTEGDEDFIQVSRGIS
jgi:hypothetical protein